MPDREPLSPGGGYGIEVSVCSGYELQTVKVSARKGTSKMLQLINMKMRTIRRDESLDPDEKRRALGEWTRKRNEALKMTVGKINEAR